MDINKAILLYLNHLSTERNLAANTLSSYKKDLDNYANWLNLNQQDLTKVLEKDIQKFLSSFRKNRA